MLIMKAPSKLCVYSDGLRKTTIKFLNDIDAIFLNGVKNAQIDFTSCQYIGAAASVMLFAKINRIQLRTKNPQFFRFKWPNRKTNESGYGYVIRTGLAKALLAGEEQKLNELTTDEAIYQSAVEPYGQVVGTVVTLYKHAPLNDVQLRLLTSAVSEAMLNVSHHAYEDAAYAVQTEELGGKRWWQCSWYDPKKNIVTFIIYDVGIGLGRSFQQGDISFSQMSELNCVLTALTEGESRFRNAGRGNGSEDMKRPIRSDSGESEVLLIFTGNAKYIYTSVQQALNCEPVSEHIQGTLVEWSLVPRSENDD